MSGNINTDCSTIPPSSCSSSSCADCIIGYNCCINMSSCCINIPAVSVHPHPPPLLPLHSTAACYSTSTPSTNTDFNRAIQSYADEPEFVSIDDEKVKKYLMQIGQRHLQNQKQLIGLDDRSKQNREPKISHVFSIASSKEQQEQAPVVYEIIELDDEEEREKLKQIKYEAEKLQNNCLKSTYETSCSISSQPTRSFNISLIPKNNNGHSDFQQSKITICNQNNQNSAASKHKIVAEIDLLDSSSSSSDDNSDDDEPNNKKSKIENSVYYSHQEENQGPDNNELEEDDEDDDLPLLAVSCELQYDDDDDDNLNVTNPSTSIYAKNSYQNCVVSSNSKNQGQLSQSNVQWNEGHRDQRVYFQCFLCGKKVQSSYNLRRHMMIHTGERPFGCDMCDRKFREFSDLKKHRRRHASEPIFLCMICRKYPPQENDSTRCVNCNSQTKNAIMMAGMRSESRELSSDNKKNEQLDEINQNDTNGSNTTNSPQAAAVSQNIAKTNILSSTQLYTSADRDSLDTSSRSSNLEDSNHIVLDNIPAVHRPGYNELGLITRKEFPCPLCHRAFGTRHNLKRHYMIHSGEKPFSCTKCRKPFREYSTLKKHMVTHIRDRWYKCVRCPLKFRDFLEYTSHKESHSPGDGEDDDSQLFILPDGNTSSQNKDINSNDDEESSGNEDWLECCECDERFSSVGSYNDHMKEHGKNIKCYECYICKQQFDRRNELEAHIQQHNKDSIDLVDEDSE